MAKKDKDKKSSKKKDDKKKSSGPKLSAKDRVILEDVRGVFLYIKEPRPLNEEDKKDDDKDPQYEITVLVNDKKQSKQVAKVKALVEAVAKEASFNDPDDWLNPIKSGDSIIKKAKKRGKDPVKAMAGCTVLKLKTYYKPDIATRNNETPMQEDWEEMGFSGCYFNVSLTAKPYDHKGNEGVRLQLGNVMFRKPGERVGGGVSAKSEFADYADEHEDD